MKRAVAIAVITGLGFGGLAALAYSDWPSPAQPELQAPSHPRWSEAPWPFPADEWGKGKAFRCATTDCGVEVNLYLRAKVGFCNCTTGVSDDEELERLADFNLMGQRLPPLGVGNPISVAWMKGRSRAYGHPRGSAFAIAFNDRCDAVVATALVAHPRPAAIEPGIIGFLNSKTILQWAETTLGL